MHYTLKKTFHTNNGNESFEKMSGYSLREVFGKTPRVFQGEKTLASDRKKITEENKKQKAQKKKLSA